MSKNLLSIWFAIAAIAAVGCAGSDSPETSEGDAESFREEHEAAPGYDGGVPDGGLDDDQPDCPSGACRQGETRCQGDLIQTCEANPGSECGGWTEGVECSTPGESCVEGRCAAPEGCVDADGDGHGTQCPGGRDCDDSDPTVHVDAPELCDHIDNDCDGEIDEDFALGMPCTNGDGACASEGLTSCGENGELVCDAPPPQGGGEPEECDGVDNDCDGEIDNGGVCAYCDDDIYEPNDDVASATPLEMSDPLMGFLCPIDEDFFELNTQAGGTYHVSVAFPAQLSDLAVDVYENGTVVDTFDNVGEDFERFTIQAQNGTSHAIAVKNGDQAETFFRVSAVEQLSCPEEDAFVPNQSIGESATFPPGWMTEAYICSGTSDWFYMGELAVDDEIMVEILGAGAADLDLYVYGDPDGDGTFDEAGSSAGSGSDEWIRGTIQQAGPFVFEVRDYSGSGGAYDVHWTLN